jgi:hypothetical protein
LSEVAEVSKSQYGQNPKKENNLTDISDSKKVEAIST